MVTRTRASAPRTIRRYGNRKLYDPVDRRYVTLAELARLVARGHDVRVLDQATGADLTNLTFAQALLDTVRDGASRIPREALRQLIRFAAGAGAASGRLAGARGLGSRGRARRPSSSSRACSPPAA